MTSINISKDALDIHKIAYEQGITGLNSQESDLTAIRQRATAIISISGLAATLLGREALKVPSGKVLWLNMGSYEWLALICLGVSVACTIQILRPRKGTWVSLKIPLRKGSVGVCQRECRHPLTSIPFHNCPSKNTNPL